MTESILSVYGSSFTGRATIHLLATEHCTSYTADTEDVYLGIGGMDHCCSSYMILALLLTLFCERLASRTAAAVVIVLVHSSSHMDLHVRN